MKRGSEVAVEPPSPLRLAVPPCAPDTSEGSDIEEMSLEQSIAEHFGVSLSSLEPPQAHMDLRTSMRVPLQSAVPRLRICIFIVGSRGDVQPFVAFAKRLLLDGHAVRIATHETFREFVTKHGIEFYPIAGDPKDLMAFMEGASAFALTKKFEAVHSQRQWVRELLQTSWQAATTSLEEDTSYQCDVIIANPPSFVGFHIAQRLGIHLHMAFTMPWTPTTEVPQPFMRTIPTTNYATYRTLDLSIWAGMHDIINAWREQTLGLAPLPISGYDVLNVKKVPFIYCFSEALLPRPADWGQHVDVTGFWFLDLGSEWTPPSELADFLAAGPPPVFIGFGSIVVSDPDKLTRTVLEAIKLAGVRAIIQQGWAGMNVNQDELPENVLFIGSAPHDWLFTHCAAVVHHGGAGTTSAGVRAGLPTVIVPFFGDQFFWGDAIHREKIGGQPIPHASLTAKKLADSITTALSPEIVANAKEAGLRIEQEDGVGNGVMAFYEHLPLDSMICNICKTSITCVTCVECQKHMCQYCYTEDHVANETDKDRLLHHLNLGYVNWSHGTESDWPALSNAAASAATVVRATLNGVSQLIGARKPTKYTDEDQVTDPTDASVAALDLPIAGDVKEKKGGKRARLLRRLNRLFYHDAAVQDDAGAQENPSLRVSRDIVEVLHESQGDLTAVSPRE